MKTQIENPIFKNSFKMLGTDIHLILVLDNKNDRKKAEDDFGELVHFYKMQEKIFSRFDLKSELSQLNSRLREYHETSEEILHVAESSLYFYDLTLGYFDPRVIEVLENIGYCKNFREADFLEITDGAELSFLKENLHKDLKIEKNKIFLERRMDFSGIAKGYITDRGVLFLRKRGWKNFLLDSGGDMFAVGTDQFREKWKIGLEGISEKQFFLDIQNQAVATSGVTRRKWEKNKKRYHHIINPKNPCEFSFDLRSVTVIEETTEKADVLAKVLFLMNKKEGLEFSRAKKIKSFFLDYRGNLYLSPEAKSFRVK